MRKLKMFISKLDNIQNNFINIKEAIKDLDM